MLTSTFHSPNIRHHLVVDFTLTNMISPEILSPEQCQMH